MFVRNSLNLASIQTAVLSPTGKVLASASGSLQGFVSPPGTDSQGPYVMVSWQVDVPVDIAGTLTIDVSVTDTHGSKSNVEAVPFPVYRSASMATIVAPTGANPQSLILMDGVLYWAESGEDALKSVPASGGSATVLATRMVNPASLAFSGSNVIWLDDRAVTPATCTATNVTRVLKQTAASGASSVLASGPSCSGGSSQIALIGATVYWVSSTSNPSTWVIQAVPLSGAAATTVRTTTTPIVALTASGGTLYWMENPYPSAGASIFALPPGSGSPTRVASGFSADANTFAVDGTAVYYATPNTPATNPPTETLWLQPLAGGAAHPLSSSIATPVQVLSTVPLGGNSVVWIDSGAVRSVPAAGGTVTVLAAITGVPLDVLYDGTNVRWTEVTAAGQHGETGAIRSVALSGGAVTVVHEGGDAPRKLAQDLQGRLNWTEGGPVGITEGFARIARIDSPASAVTIVAGINAAYAPYAPSAGPPYLYPLSLPLAATPTALLIADQWRLKSIPLTGGSVNTVASPGGGLIASLATDGTSIYWDDSTSSVSKVSVGGGAITALVPPSVVGGYAGPGGPIAIAPNGTLYWVVNDGCNPSGSCLSASVASAPSRVPSTSLDVIASGAGFVPDLAVNSTTVYYADWSTSVIVAVPGGNTMIDVRPVPPLALALDGSTLYWANLSQINNYNTPVLFGALPIFTLDSTYLYFTDSQYIRKIPK